VLNGQNILFLKIDTVYMSNGFVWNLTILNISTWNHTYIYTLWYTRACKQCISFPSYTYHTEYLVVEGNCEHVKGEMRAHTDKWRLYEYIPQWIGESTSSEHNYCVIAYSSVVTSLFLFRLGKHVTDPAYI
jgi:hypothetical protein